MTEKASPKNTCHLILKHKWYDAIERGEKDKEYRKNTPYYQKRLLPENIRFVTLHRGYSSVTMTFEILKKEKTRKIITTHLGKRVTKS